LGCMPMPHDTAGTAVPRCISGIAAIAVQVTRHHVLGDNKGPIGSLISSWSSPIAALASQTTAGLFLQYLPGCKARSLPLLHSGTPSAPCTTRQALRARSVTAPDLVARISGDIVAL